MYEWRLNLGGFFRVAALYKLFVLLLFRPQFRNQYDNDVTVWSPQVKYHLLCFPPSASDLLTHHSQAWLWYAVLLFPVCVDPGPYPSDRVCHGGSEAGISNCRTEVQNPRSPGCIKGSRSESWKKIIHPWFWKAENALEEILYYIFVFKSFLTFDMLFPQRAQSELAAHQKKILHVDNHIGISIAGLTADARLLWSVIAAPF